MTLKLIHFTDIHFDIQHAEACEAAAAFAHEQKVDLVVISGDVTQKGYVKEFRSAAAWMKLLPQPQMVCPGNHDVPYYASLGRIAWPWARFDRMVGDGWRRGLELPGLAVQALNTARGLQLRLNWSKGVVDLSDLDAAIGRLQAAPLESLRVFVCHHPLVEVTGGPMTGEVKRGHHAAERLCQGEVDLIMSGHIHAPFATLLPFGDGKTLATGASTLSVRERGAAPGFNLLEVDDALITVRAFGWRQDHFAVERTWAFSRRVRAPQRAAA